MREHGDLRQSGLTLLFAGLVWLAFSASAPLQLAAQASGENRIKYSVSGTVIDAVTGEPLRRVLVEVVGESSGVALTDSYGHFQIDGLPEMQAILTTEKPGFFREQELPSGTPGQNEIHVGPLSEKLLLKMTPESVVLGRVRSVRGEPLEGVPVRLACIRSTAEGSVRELCGNAFTDENGQFRLDHVTPGSYYLEAGPSSDYAVRHSRMSLDLAAGQHAEVDFSLEPDPQLSRQDIVAQDYAPRTASPALLRVSAVRTSSQISGTVLNALNGQPIPGTQVVIALSTDQTSFTTQITGDDGTFSFVGFPRGTYLLRANREGFRTNGRRTRQPLWTRVTLGEDLDAGKINFYLLPDSSISGVVANEENEAVRDAQVLLFRRSLRGGKQVTTLQAEMETDGAGYYHFSHLTSGQYFVTVVAEPWYARHRSDCPPEFDVAYPIVINSIATAPADAAPIVLQPGEHLEVDANLRPAPALHIVVSNTSPDPTWPGMVSLMVPLYGGFTSPALTETTIINGSVIEMNGVPPGHYVVSLQSFAGGSASSRDRELDLFADTEIDGNQL